MSNHSNAAYARRALCATILTVLAMNYAAAQVAGPNSFPNMSAADLMRSYASGAAGPLERQELLIGVLNKTLPSNDANIRITRQSLAKARAIEDKILLTKVLASMYTPRAHSQQNLLIESDIKKLIDSPDPRLAPQAVIEYSRLGYPSDRYEVLQRARDAKILDDDAYYGELAHGLRLSSPAQQMQMLAELETSRNPYAYEILAFTFCSEEMFLQLDRPAQAKLFNALSRQEQNFPLALDSFGVVDMTRYTVWIDAVATMESRLSGTPYAELVLRRLSGPRLDPRKILAVFANREGQKVIRESNDVAQLRRLLLRAQAYADSLPQNRMLNGAAAAFTKQMGGR